MTVERIQIRHDTAANWTSNNPVLASGEPGYEEGTGRVKFGDGVRSWNNLRYSAWFLRDDFHFFVEDYGAVGNGGADDANAIQSALDAADGWSAATSTWSGARGGVVRFQWGKTYGSSKSLVSGARIRMLGGSGATFGGRGTVIKALPGGSFYNTNGPAGQGFDPGNPWLIRLTRNAATSYDWWHAGSIEGIRLDLNGQFVGGCIGMGAGEVSLVERVQIGGSGWQTRTSTQAVFNGTATVSVPDGAFDLLEDFQARLASPQFPTYTDLALTVSTTAGSPVATVTTGSVPSTYQGAMPLGGFRSVAYVQSVDSSTQLTMSMPAENTATGVSMTLTQPREFRIMRIDSTTQITLDRPVPYTGTGSLTILRGRPGMRWLGGTATGLIRSLNVSGNSGAGLEYVNGAGNSLDSITGDNNAGPLIRFHKCGLGDTDSVVLNSFKAENNNYGDASAYRLKTFGDHDPVIAIDNCGMVNIEINGGVAYSSETGSRDLIRIQQSQAFWQYGYPSLTIKGIEADNPWNPHFENIIRDIDTGKAVKAGSIYLPTFGGRFYPMIAWNKDHQIVNGDLRITGGKVYVDGLQLAAGVEDQKFVWNWLESPSVEVQSTFNQVVNGGIQLGGYGAARKNSVGALNDEWRWRVPVSAGTWRFRLNYTKDPSFGIFKFQYTYDLTGASGWVDIGAAVDAYSATAIQNNQTVALTGIALPSSGVILVRVITTGKNALATGYEWWLSQWSLVRSG